VLFPQSKRPSFTPIKITEEQASKPKFAQFMMMIDDTVEKGPVKKLWKS
jgi:hypothetical protein